MTHTAGNKEFVPAHKSVTVHLKTSLHRALERCAAHHNMTMGGLAAKLLEAAIFKETQTLHNFSSSPKLPFQKSISDRNDA